MNMRAFGIRASILLVAALTLAGHPAPATTITIDFENLPSLPPQPNNFAAAGPMQTYTDPGVFTISGGVVLGNPTFLTSFPAHGSPPNLYGTTDIADPSLLSTITLTFPSAEGVVSATGVLFNGQPVPESYEVDAFSGATRVGSEMFTNMAADSSASGFGNFSLNSTGALPITSLTITTPNASVNGWDFLVDTITITAAIPEPSTALILLTGALGLFVARRRHDRTATNQQRRID